MADQSDPLRVREKLEMHTSLGLPPKPRQGRIARNTQANAESGLRTIPEENVATGADLNERAVQTELIGRENAGVVRLAREATYVGWNAVASGYRAGRYCFSAGGYIPFAATQAERIARGDPRPSVEERYPSHAAYVAKVKAQADTLVAQRYMLADDAAKTVAEAQ